MLMRNAEEGHLRGVRTLRDFQGDKNNWKMRD
jgi:hypothetical protein